MVAMLLRARSTFSLPGLRVSAARYAYSIRSVSPREVSLSSRSANPAARSIANLLFIMNRACGAVLVCGRPSLEVVASPKSKLERGGHTTPRDGDLDRAAACSFRIDVWRRPLRFRARHEIASNGQVERA